MKRPFLIAISGFIALFFIFLFFSASFAAELDPSATPATGTLVPTEEDLKALGNLGAPAGTDSQTPNSLPSGAGNNNDIQFFPGGEAAISPELQQKLVELQSTSCQPPWWRYAIDALVGLGAAIIFWVITRLMKMKKPRSADPAKKY